MLFPIKDYNPTRRTAYLTILIIAINVVVFLYQSLVIPDYLKNRISPLNYHIYSSAMVPREITHFKNFPVPVGEDYFGRVVYFPREIPPVLSLFTSMFMHGSLMHLLGNILFLWRIPM